jgi:pimeloyl-ACP methyl ester carboxylesterase
MNLKQYRNTCTIDNQTMSYLDIGQGPVILLGHAYLWDSAMWAPQIQQLIQHYRCIVPELWGHGLSGDIPTHCRSVKHLAKHYLSLMDQLQIEQFSILGLSVGGIWGAELTLLAPTRVQTLVMMGCFIGFEPEVSRAKYGQMLDRLEQTQSIPESLIDQIAPLFFADDLAQTNPQLIEDFKRHLASLTAKQIETVARLGQIIFGRRDIMEDVEQLTLPCLIMTGVEDKCSPILEGYLMHDAIDGSEYIHIPQAGHISTLEQSDFINRHLLEFYAKHLN